MAAQGLNTRHRNLADNLVRDISALSGQLAWQNSEPIPSNGRNANRNVSLRTGEEFSMEFLKDHTRAEPPRFPGLRRMESECASDANDSGHGTRILNQFENGGCVEKFNGYNNVGVVTRKAFGELNSNQGGVVQTTAAPSVHLPDHAQSNNCNGAVVPERAAKVKLLCSFRGKILPRSTDGKLKYVGGETHIISIHKNLSWEELKRKTSAICPQAHSIKYQLPGDDLDSLISVTSDEDLQNMIEEYNGQQRPEGSHRPRLFLIPLGVSENSLYDENNVQQSNSDYRYVAALNGNVDPTPRKNSGETSYRVTCLDRIPSFHNRSPTQLLQVETRGGVHAMHPSQMFNGLHYNMSPYQSPPVSPMPLQRAGSKGGYSQLYGNNSSSESNSSYITAQPDISSVEMNESRYHQRQPLPSVIYPPYKQNDANRTEHHILPHGGFSENFLSPISGRVDSVVSAPDEPEESEVLPSGSTNSNDFQFGLSHSHSDSTLELCGGQFAYCSQLNLKAQMQERLLQLHSNTDLSDCRTQSNILDFMSTEGGETTFKCSPNPGENDTIHLGIFSEGNHYNETYQNQDTTRQGGAGKCGTIRRATSTEMESKALALGGNLTSPFAADSWRQIKEDHGLMTTNHAIPFAEDVIDRASNHESPRVLSLFTEQPSDLVQELGTDVTRARNSEVSRLLPDIGVCSNGSFPVHIASKSSNTIVVEDQGFLEFGLPQKKVDSDNSTVISPEKYMHSSERQDYPLSSSNNNNLHDLRNALGDSSSPDEDLSLDQTFGEAAFGHETVKISSKDMNLPENKSEEAESDHGDKDHDHNDKNIAEIEANVYGLQIIKNADLEDLTELGSGTYGTVYHGKWRGTDVAIKRIRKSCFAGRSSEQDRLTKDFWREAQILSNLHHPNVVAFYGAVPDGAGGTLATVTEFMVNGSLRHALLKKDKLLDSRKKIIIAMDAAFGMEYLHSKNIVHFDLKCDNLLVNLRDPQRPICKVGDLGLSRIKRNTLISGGVRGTLPWMAPELLNGSSNRVSEKVDVFSFGISMWEILTGDEPYADMHCGAIIGGIVKNTLRPPIPESCPPDWRKLMEQCWSVDPESRPSFTDITNRLRSMSMELHTKGNSGKRK